MRSLRVRSGSRPWGSSSPNLPYISLTSPLYLAYTSPISPLGAERLTPLGELLTKLPLDARLGKLIVYGLCFGAADEALTLGAVLSARSPFLSPAERREEADHLGEM